MNDIELKQRLCEWAEALGGDQFRRLGYAGAYALPTNGGTTPPDLDPVSNSGADEIEHIVRRMEQSGRWRESRVLRAEYFMAGLCEGERLQRLSRIGLTMSRTAYYTYLGSARAFVLGAIACSSEATEHAITEN
jgi:hypothetical protein